MKELTNKVAGISGNSRFARKSRVGSPIYFPQLNPLQPEGSRSLVRTAAARIQNGISDVNQQRHASLGDRRANA